MAERSTFDCALRETIRFRQHYNQKVIKIILEKKVSLEVKSVNLKRSGFTFLRRVDYISAQRKNYISAQNNYILAQKLHISASM